MNTEIITIKTQTKIAQYLEACDPLLMMTLLMELGRSQRHELSDKQYQEISCCHNLLAAIYRNE